MNEQGAVNEQGAKAEVWLADLDACALALAACERTIPRLSPDDLARIDAVADPITRARRITATIALRLVLERTFGPSLRAVPLPRERLGRPVLPEGFVGSFTVSHCGGLALIGVTRAERIGVDLEVLRPVRMAERRRTVIEAAAGTLVRGALPVDPVARFLKAWVMLEALAKADGGGIGHLLTQLGAVGNLHGQPDAAAMMARGHGLLLSVLEVGVGVFAGVACCDVDLVFARFPDTVAGIPDFVSG